MQKAISEAWRMADKISASESTTEEMLAEAAISIIKNS